MQRFLSAVALAGALGLTTATVPAASASSATTLTAQQSEELIVSYAHLVDDFYKKVDRQAALGAARDGIMSYLKASHVTNAQLPAARASDDDTANVRELQHEVALAVEAYGDKLKPEEGLSPSTQLTYAAIAGVLGSVKDKYTTFLTPKEYAALNDNLDGTAFGGVGISYSLDEKTKTLHIENVILDGPSDKAGLHVEDRITAVDGMPVAQILAPAASEKDEQKRVTSEQKLVTKVLRGDAGTRVRLAIERGGKAIPPVTVTRAEIKPPSVLAKMLPGDIGYVDLTVFGQSTGKELDTALHRLDAEGAKAYVLDLRYNGGGYLNAAIDVASKFIASGPIVSVQSRAGSSTQYDAENTAIAPRPLAVLVNGKTASASEITAGALQDANVGTIVGTQTYGKGVVQSIWSLRDGSAIKITTARYFTPSGRDINSVGIAPEVKVDFPEKDARVRFADPKTDPQLIAALNEVQRRLAALPAH